MLVRTDNRKGCRQSCKRILDNIDAGMSFKSHVSRLPRYQVHELAGAVEGSCRQKQ